jgi:Mg-chelatase subunit ChlD/type II secretory pathway pseudopilin PulG
MNPELPPNPREELEQRLTALLLGELSAEESAALHRAMEQDGELAKLFARLHHTVGLVRETVASPSEPPSAQAAPAKLSTARREKLLAHFKTIAPPEFAPEKRRARFTLVEFAAVMIILGLLAAISFPTLSNFGNWGSAESAHLNIELAPDAALKVAKPHRGEQLEPAPTALAFRALSSADSSETSSSGLNRSETLSADFDAGATAKRPTALAPLPRKPSAPSAAGSHDSFARSSTVIGDDGLTLGDKPELGQSFYRFNPDSGGAGRGGLPQLSGPVDAGEPGKAAEVEPLLRENIPVRYTSPGSVAVALESLTDAWSDNRTLTRGDSVDPATGFEIARAGDLPASSGQQLETRTFNVKPEVLYQALEGVGGLALNGLGEQTPQTQFGIPRVGVTGASSGGGGGGGGQGGGGSSFSLVTNSLAGTDGAVNKFYSDLGVNLDANAGESLSYDDRTGQLTVRATPDGLDQIEQISRVLAVEPPNVNLKARFAETTQNEDRALGFDWYLGSNLNTSKDASTAQGGTTPSAANQPVDVLNEGVVTTLSGRAAGVDFANGPTPSEATPLGRSGTDSEGEAPASPVLDVGRIAPEPNVYSVDAVGYFDVPTQTATSAGIAITESSRRQSASIVLPGFTMPAETPPSLVADEEKKLISDPLLIAGLGHKEESLTQTGSAGRALAETPASQKNWAYVEKQRQLQDEIEVGRLLKRKINIEKIDLSLPKSSEVEIVETAQADSAPGQSAWGKLRSAVSGDVERAATIKLERDKSDIAGYSGSRDHNVYDPYFIQTESETIQSEAILGKVVAELKLDELWAKQKGAGAKLKTNEAIAMLRGRLDLRPVRNTTLVEIRAKSDKPEEAAQIANAVAQAYKGWRVDRGNRLVAAGAEELEKQSILQDEKIRQAKVELERLRTELSIPDADAGLIAADPTPIRKPSTNAPIPQPEIPTSENNFSTFSLNVSDVSFKLAAASLEKGQMPDAASVRSEEFINAFDYRDPEPAAGTPIAFAYERARYPFAHNRDLLRFSLKTAAAGRQAGRPLNLVLLLDNSGSMERADRVRIIREALRVLAEQLQPQDKLSVITFARTARLWVDGAPGSEAAAVAMAASEIAPQGGTNLEDAMNLAYQTAARHYLANGINRVVLLTDGAANLGDVEPDSLKQKVEAQRQQGIALDCFGIGWEGLNDDLLEVLSRNGDGRYGFINSPEEAATDFVGQLAGALKVAASDVKVQVEFNPKRVTSYRQIGYAKHQLTKEQFRDNTVDAAEIAAQEAGNALYTVELNPAGVGPLGTVRVRYKVPGTTDYREQAWDVPYTGNSPALEQASPAMRLAASASAFSEWLVASPFAGEVTPDALLGYLNGVPEVFGADSRPKKLEWMIRQAKSLEGK